MIYEVIVMYHTYKFIENKSMTYGQMQAFTYLDLKESEELEE